MRGSKVIVPLLAAVLAGATGFYAGTRHAYANVARAMAESLAAATIQPPVAAAPGWEISDYTDKMSDRKSFWLSVKSTTSPEATLQISCSPAESISIYSDRFFTHSDDYYVTYRIDKRKAVTFDRWHSITNFSSPPDEAKFISELSDGHQLLVDISSAGDASYSLSFDISGYNQKLAEFRSKCKTLQSRTVSTASAS